MALEQIVNTVEAQEALPLNERSDHAAESIPPVVETGERPGPESVAATLTAEQPVSLPETLTASEGFAETSLSASRELNNDQRSREAILLEVEAAMNACKHPLQVSDAQNTRLARALWPAVSHTPEA